MQSDTERFVGDVLSWPERIIRHQGKTIALDVMDLTRHYVGRFFPIRRALDHGYGILGTALLWDVNIIAKYGLRHYGYMLKTLVPSCLRFYSEG